MAIPSVLFTVRDGALGQIPPGAGNVHLKLGCSPLGLINTIQSVTDLVTLQAALGKGGPLTEAAALALAVAGSKSGGVLVCPVNPSTYGAASAVSHTGAGVGTLAVAVKPSSAFQLKCVAAGSATTSTWQFSFDGGLTYGPVTTAAATLMVPGASFTTLAFGAGTSVSGDVVTVTAAGATALASGTGTLVPTLSAACPVDAYSVIVTITTAGALGVAQFTYSLDGGLTTSGAILTAGSGIYIVPDTGLQITLAGVQTAGDAFTFTTTTASYTTTDVNNAFTAVLADSRQWFLAHVVGLPATVAAAATLLATVDAQLVTAAGSYRYARGAIEVPVDTDSATIAAFAASSSTRVMACAGTHLTISPLNGRKFTRPAAWSAIARACAVSASEDLGRVASGSLPGVVSIVRDEQATPGLDAGRFTTLRTLPGYPGFWVTNGRMMAAPGSDYTFLQYGRVMDIACSATYQALLRFLNDSVRVNANGTIRETDARAIEAYCDNHIRNSLPLGSISDLSFSINRVTNVLSTQRLDTTIRILPLGYAKTITADIGFANPSLAIAAA